MSTYTRRQVFWSSTELGFIGVCLLKMNGNYLKYLSCSSSLFIPSLLNAYACKAITFIDKCTFQC